MISIYKRFIESLFLLLIMILYIGCSDIFSSYPPPTVYKLYPGEQLQDAKISQLDLNGTETTILVDGFRVSSFEYTHVHLLPGEYDIRFRKDYRGASQPFELYNIFLWYSKSKSKNVTCEVTLSLKAGHTYQISSDINETAKQYCVYVTDQERYEDVQNCCRY